MIGTLNHRRGDGVSNRDQCGARTMRRTLTTSSFFYTATRRFAARGRLAAPQILTQPTKQAGCARTKGVATSVSPTAPLPNGPRYEEAINFE
jgi:hypothetical protein